MHYKFENFDSLTNNIKENLAQSSTVADFFCKFDPSKYDLQMFSDNDKRQRCLPTDLTHIIKKISCTDLASGCTVALDIVEMNQSKDQIANKIISLTGDKTLLEKLSADPTFREKYALCSDSKAYYCMKKIIEAINDSKITSAEIFERSIIKEALSNKEYRVNISEVKVKNDQDLTILENLLIPHQNTILRKEELERIQRDIIFATTSDKNLIQIYFEVAQGRDYARYTVVESFPLEIFHSLIQYYYGVDLECIKSKKTIPCIIKIKAGAEPKDPEYDPRQDMGPIVSAMEESKNSFEDITNEFIHCDSIAKEKEKITSLPGAYKRHRDEFIIDND